MLWKWFARLPFEDPATKEKMIVAGRQIEEVKQVDSQFIKRLPSLKVFYYLWVLWVNDGLDKLAEDTLYWWFHVLVIDDLSDLREEFSVVFVINT